MLARAWATPRGRAILISLAVLGLAVVAVVFWQLSRVAPATAAASPTPTASPSPSPSPTASPSPTPTPAPTPNPFASRRLTVLILGSDSNPSRLARGSGRLTDSIIVLSVNAAHTKVSMISLPRDMVDIPLGNGQVWRSKINAISYYRGEASMKKAIAATIRQPIDYYVEINMVDFGALVNAIGGVDIKVPTTIYDPSIGLYVKAGTRHMSGNLALSYARSRHTTSDWDRAARQQALVSAIIRKIVDPRTKFDIPKLLASMKSLRADLPLDKFIGLIQVARAASHVKYSSAVLAPPRFSLFAGIEPGTGRGYIEEPNLAAIRAYAASVMGK
jgi:LCP family protein required for cell wall assembly